MRQRYDQHSEGLSRCRAGAWADERGQGLVEYALIIALVSLAAIAALGLLSGEINDLFRKTGNVLNNVEAAGSGSGGGGGGIAPSYVSGATIACPGGAPGCNPNELATVSPGTWNGTPAPGFSYQWMFNEQSSDVPACDFSNPDWGPAPGSTDSTTYTLPPNPVGTDGIGVRVTASNGAGSATHNVCLTF